MNYGTLDARSRHRHLLVTVVLLLKIDPSAADVAPSNVIEPAADWRWPLSAYVKVHVPSFSEYRLRNVADPLVAWRSAEIVIALHWRRIQKSTETGARLAEDRSLDTVSAEVGMSLHPPPPPMPRPVRMLYVN